MWGCIAGCSESDSASNKYLMPAIIVHPQVDSSFDRVFIYNEVNIFQRSGEVFFFWVSARNTRPKKNSAVFTNTQLSPLIPIKVRDVCLHHFSSIGMVFVDSVNRLFLFESELKAVELWSVLPITQLLSSSNAIICKTCHQNLFQVFSLKYFNDSDDVSSFLIYVDFAQMDCLSEDGNQNDLIEDLLEGLLAKEQIDMQVDSTIFTVFDINDLIAKSTERSRLRDLIFSSEESQETAQNNEVFLYRLLEDDPAALNLNKDFKSVIKRFNFENESSSYCVNDTENPQKSTDSNFKKSETQYHMFKKKKLDTQIVINESYYDSLNLRSEDLNSSQKIKKMKEYISRLSNSQLEKDSLQESQQLRPRQKLIDSILNTNEISTSLLYSPVKTQLVNERIETMDFSNLNDQRLLPVTTLNPSKESALTKGPSLEQDIRTEEMATSNYFTTFENLRLVKKNSGEQQHEENMEVNNFSFHQDRSNYSPNNNDEDSCVCPNDRPVIFRSFSTNHANDSQMSLKGLKHSQKSQPTIFNNLELENNAESSYDDIMVSMVIPETNRSFKHTPVDIDSKSLFIHPRAPDNENYSVFLSGNKNEERDSEGKDGDNQIYGSGRFLKKLDNFVKNSFQQNQLNLQTADCKILTDTNVDIIEGRSENGSPSMVDDAPRFQFNSIKNFNKTYILDEKSESRRNSMFGEECLNISQVQKNESYLSKVDQDELSKTGNELIHRFEVLERKSNEGFSVYLHEKVRLIQRKISLKLNKLSKEVFTQLRKFNNRQNASIVLLVDLTRIIDVGTIRLVFLAIKGTLIRKIFFD